MSEFNNDIPKHKVKTDEERLQVIFDKYRINAGETFAEKDYLLERDGIGFCPRGNVMAISAEKKAGKTWFCMAMCAALLSGNFLGMKARETKKGEPYKVLYFDTEQDKGDGQKIQKRVHGACGWDFGMNNDRFVIMHLRELAQEERRKVVCETIELMKPDMVIVDGIRDLLSDFNDLEQSADVIQDFMRLSSEFECSIWAVLHVNPNSDKMRGHLGTELGNKVADILHMTKQKHETDEDNVIYKMEEIASRGHRDIHSITFKIDDEQPYGMPVITDGFKEKKTEYSIEQVRGWMTEVVKTFEMNWPATALDIKKAIRGVSQITHGEELQEIIKTAQKQKMIVEQPKKEMIPGQRYPKWYYNEDELLFV